MSQNYNPQNDPNRDYGIGDYYQQSGEQPSYDMPKAKPYPYGQLEPPAKGIFKKWLKVLTKPSPATFASEIPDANWNTTIIGVLIYIFVLALTYNISTGRVIGFTTGDAIAITIGTMIITIIGLIINSVILYRLAKTVGGGQGNLMTQTYLYSLYTTPIAVITNVIAFFIPNLYGLPALPLSVIYELFLTYCMLQPVHRITAAKARQVVFMLVLLAIILGVILGFFIFSRSSAICRSSGGDCW